MPGSNWRLTPYHGVTLPTELIQHMVTCMGLEPITSTLRGWRLNQFVEQAIYKIKRGHLALSPNALIIIKFYNLNLCMTNRWRHHTCISITFSIFSCIDNYELQHYGSPPFCKFLIYINKCIRELFKILLKSVLHCLFRSTISL